MQHTIAQRKRLPWIIAGAAVAAFLLRRVLWALGVQLLAGYLLMVLALPLCRLLEKQLSPSAAAGLSFGALALAALVALLVVIPPLVQQFRQLAADFPALLQWGEELLGRVQTMLQARGLDLTPVRDELFAQLSQRAGALVSGIAQAVTQALQSLSRVDEPAQVAQLRADGEFEKADDLLEISQTYLLKLLELKLLKKQLKRFLQN